MLIRSQDKMILVPIGDDGIQVISTSGYHCVDTETPTHSYTLGAYSTKEKALKVLDMIQEHSDITDWNKVLLVGKPSGTMTMPPMTFEMPQDSEVE